MSKELVKQETSTEVSTTTYNANDWGDVALEAKDLVLPKILIQQAMSAAVKSKVCQEGDLLNTLTEENLGQSVELLPFFKRESIVIEKWNGKRFDFHTIIPYDGKLRPFEEEIAGVRYKNSHMYEFFCLTKDLGIPHIIAFKGTSNKVGRNLFTLMYVQNPAQKLTPAGKWITYSGKIETSKDGDSYYVSAFKPSSLASEEEVNKAKEWVQILKNTNFETAEEKTSEPAPVETKRF